MKRTESQIISVKEIQNHDYIFELQSKFSTVQFKRIQKTETAKKTNKSDGDGVFLEGEIKKNLYALNAPAQSHYLRTKCSYFSQRESKHDIYKYDEAKEFSAKEKFVVHYIGHSTVLIQGPGFNVLTDPIYYDLDALYYPEKTKSYPFIQFLPKIDVILISHNRRDHVDRKSLQELLEHYRTKVWPQPKVLVPMGDKKLLQTFGFIYITELDWFSRITIRVNRTSLNFVCIPALQKFSRYQINSYKSLITGWIISPEREDVIFKYTGDTRALSSSTQLAVDAVIYNEIVKKKCNIGTPEGSTSIPKIVCLEPSGPNYTRSTVESNHQSSSYSALLKFIQARNLSRISGIPVEMFLPKIKTVMVHHNKFQVGPDRFNEGVFVVKKLLNYLRLDDEELSKEHERQKLKLERNLDKQKLKELLPMSSRSVCANLPTQTSILVRAKNFVIDDLRAAEVSFDMDKEKLREIMVCYLVKNTVFPMIGERLTCDELMAAGFKGCGKYAGNRQQKPDVSS